MEEETKKDSKVKTIIKRVAGALLIAAALVAALIATRQKEPDLAPAETETQVIEIPTQETETEEEELMPEEQVYTFLQGPKAWESGTDWSGSWCEVIENGKTFGNFGCGMCCMANIYDTLSPYEVNPLDMYYFAKDYSGYAPTKKISAIGWGDLKTSLKRLGCSCDVYYKNDTYEAFQENVKNSECMIALVSSYCDDTYWKDTSGHYVNLWLYDEEDDTVFLAEPGSPTNNRSRIPLRYVYDALKTSSKFQYLLVDSYKEEENEWKQTGMDPEIEWTQPDYYEPKTED